MKRPHCPTGVQVQLTTAFWGPLVMVAAIPAVELAVIVGGGVKPGVKVTVIGRLELRLPQAANGRMAALAIRATKASRNDMRNDIR